MSKLQRDENVLLQAILKIKNIQEAENFFRDLLTEKEYKELNNRFKVASMLSDGLSYLQIEEKTGMSSTTIARISKCLKRENSGYQMLLSRI
jgi:TrpR-related protein YerC/YecD